MIIIVIIIITTTTTSTTIIFNDHHHHLLMGRMTWFTISPLAAVMSVSFALVAGREIPESLEWTSGHTVTGILINTSITVCRVGPVVFAQSEFWLVSCNSRHTLYRTVGAPSQIHTRRQVLKTLAELHNYWEGGRRLGELSQRIVSMDTGHMAARTNLP
ncbi:hypothetical protein PoB_001387700 [Plakobranchus ocellatus]|uniref:Uncharacterized protein n=1 Tax=Plakobranchus ocellatus TaxID=259542 RepID=A0AAV3YYH9_9GAST|nr:hypothetical protein PoB_001387700 [Plakobranchus ocellatus]